MQSFIRRRTSKPVSNHLMASLCAVISMALLMSPFSAHATIRIPKNLSKGDREETLRILGFGTSSKILSDPYPLGGYSGFELGVSVESLPTEDLAQLGSRLSAPQQDVTATKFTIGKGLFNDIDVFLQFTPYNHQDEITQYGGFLRWNFYQAKSLPIGISVLSHFNSCNISNLLTSQSYGADVIGGINVQNVSVFAGFGPIEARGTFLGGTAGVTASAFNENEFVSGLHSVLGANIHFSTVFLALQVDHYTLSVVSGKLGLRF